MSPRTLGHDHELGAANARPGTEPYDDPLCPEPSTVPASPTLGDILIVKMSLPGASEYRLEHITGGEVPDAIKARYVQDSQGNSLKEKGSFWESGVLYVAPHIVERMSTKAGTIAYQAVGASQLQIVYSYRSASTGQRVTREHELRVGPGASPFALTGSVGRHGKNHPVDVARVQQRLRYLNYPAKDTFESGQVIKHWVAVDGKAGTRTVEAIRLFQASITASNPDECDGRVEPNQHTLQWLNAANAPHWLPLPEMYWCTGKRSNGTPLIGGEYWGTSWALKAIERAYTAHATRKRYGVLKPLSLTSTNTITTRVTSLSEYPDYDGSHATHKAGMDIDWDIRENALEDTPVLCGQRTMEELFQELGANEKTLAMELVFLHATLGELFYEVLVGGTNGQCEYRRLRQFLTAAGIANRNAAHHHNHIHISLKPPLLKALSYQVIKA